MQQDGTYGDELTLRTMADMYNIEFSVMSTYGREGQITVSPINFQPRGVAVSGHLAEGQGYHYVVLQSLNSPEISAIQDHGIERTSDRDIDFQCPFSDHLSLDRSRPETCRYSSCDNGRAASDVKDEIGKYL